MYRQQNEDERDYEPPDWYEYDYDHEADVTADRYERYELGLDHRGEWDG